MNCSPVFFHFSYFTFKYVCVLKGEGSKLFRKQEKKSILWKCVENKVMSTMGLTSSVRKVSTNGTFDDFSFCYFNITSINI